MSKNPKILVPLDFSPRSFGALQYASMLANNIEGSIIGLILAHPKDYNSKKDFQAQVYALAEQKLRPILDEMNDLYPNVKKIKLEFRGVKKDIDEHILEFAKAEKVDFIILRNHGVLESPDWEQKFNSTTAYKVSLDASCPTFTFTSIPENPVLKNILVPLDTTDGSAYKLSVAEFLAKQFNAKLHLLSASSNTDDFNALQKIQDECYSMLNNKGLKVVKSDVLYKDIYSAIESYTQNFDIDLIIIMSRPGFRWSDLWISPIAKKIISKSKVPVLSVRANELIKLGF